jgi:hypothetical protein
VKKAATAALLATCFTLISCLAYSSTLKMETCCSKTSAGIQRTTRRYIPEDGTHHNHRCQNLKSYISLVTVNRSIRSSPGIWLHIECPTRKGQYFENCICTCVLFRTVSEIQLFDCTGYCTLYRRATRHVLTRVAKCIDVDDGILKMYYTR